MKRAKKISKQTVIENLKNKIQTQKDTYLEFLYNWAIKKTIEENYPNKENEENLSNMFNLKF